MKKLCIFIALMGLSAFGFADVAGSIDSASESLDGFFTSFPDWIVAITAVVTAANAVTAMLPSTSAKPIANAILKFLNILSLNIGKNKNADDL